MQLTVQTTIKPTMQPTVKTKIQQTKQIAKQSTRKQTKKKYPINNKTDFTNIATAVTSGCPPFSVLTQNVPRPLCMCRKS